MKINKNLIIINSRHIPKDKIQFYYRDEFITNNEVNFYVVVRDTIISEEMSNKEADKMLLKLDNLFL